MMQQLRARRDALTAQRSSGVAGLQDRADAVDATAEDRVTALQG